MSNIPVSSEDHTSLSYFHFVNSRLFALIVMVVLLGTIALAPLFVMHWDWRVLKPELNPDPVKIKLQFWLFWIIVQAGIWVLSLLYLFVTGCRFYKSFCRNFFSATLPIVIPGTCFFLALFGKSDIPPPAIGRFNISNIHIFGAIGVFLAFISVWGMYFVRAEIISKFEVLPPVDDAINRFIKLREEIFRLLLITVAILLSGTASISGLRIAINTANGKNYFPEEYVILYGAMNSVFLMVGYIPVQATLFVTARRLREKLNQLPNASAESIKTWFENRQKLGDILGLNLSQASAFGAPLATLLPFLSVWISHLFGNK